MSASELRTALQLPKSLEAQLREFRRRVWTIKSIEAAHRVVPSATLVVQSRCVAQVTGGEMIGQHLQELRFLYTAAIERVRTTGMKAAARRQIDRTRHIASENDALSLRRRVRDGHRR